LPTLGDGLGVTPPAPVPADPDGAGLALGPADGAGVGLALGVALGPGLAAAEPLAAGDALAAPDKAGLADGTGVGGGVPRAAVLVWIW
jgi:hypothetical protein